MNTRILSNRFPDEINEYMKINIRIKNKKVCKKIDTG